MLMVIRKKNGFGAARVGEIREKRALGFQCLVGCGGNGRGVRNKAQLEVVGVRSWKLIALYSPS